MLGNNLHLQQAISLHRAGRAAEAIPIYEKIIRTDAKAADVFNLLGLAQFQTGQLAQAATSLRRAIKLNPNIPNIDYNLARVLQAQDLLRDALKHYERALSKAPRDAEILNNLGAVLTKLDRPADAIPHFRKAVEINDGYADAWSNLGNACAKAKQYEDAAIAYKRAVALNPNLIPALGGLGLMLNLLNRHDEGLPYTRKAIALNPSVANYWITQADALVIAGEYKAAEESFNEGLRLAPESTEALWNKCCLLLACRRFNEAWPLFDNRWPYIPGAVGPKLFQQPKWAGEQVDGTLLVWGEQGLGDQILYSSMIPDLRKRARKIVLRVDDRLIPLMTRSYQGIQIVDFDTKIDEPIVAECALGDLGRYLRPDAATFQSVADGYLKADEARVRELRSRLAADGRSVVGLSWSSNNPKIGKKKSALLSDLAPLTKIQNCRFVNLQYGDTQAERIQVAREAGLLVENLGDIDATNDIDGLAALISACDAVVTVSNTTAHLAAAQGVPTWVLLPQGIGVFWFWMLEGGTTPIYSSAHLVRRQRGQSWSGLVDTMIPDLTVHLTNTKRSS